MCCSCRQFAACKGCKQGTYRSQHAQVLPLLGQLFEKGIRHTNPLKSTSKRHLSNGVRREARTRQETQGGPALLAPRTSAAGLSPTANTCSSRGQVLF